MPKLLSPFNAHPEFDIVVHDFEVGVLLLTLLFLKREDSPALLPFSNTSSVLNFGVGHPFLQTTTRFFKTKVKDPITSSPHW
jgi:hypothetical protein